MALTIQYTFANQSGLVPASELDANFTQLLNYWNTGTTVPLILTPANATGVALTINENDSIGLQILINSTSNTAGALIQNSTTGDGLGAYAILDLANSAHFWTAGLASTGHLGAFAGVSGGFTGESAVVGTFGAAVPMDIVTNGKRAIGIDGNQNLLGRGIAYCVFKATTTSRSNTAVVAADPDLQYAIPAAGTYRVQLDLVLTAAAGGATPGLQFQVSFGGSLNGSAGNQATISGLLNDVSITSAVPINTTFPNLSLGTTAAFNAVSIVGTLQSTTSGNIALLWAQNTSSASAVSVLAGSSMTITKIN